MSPSSFWSSSQAHYCGTIAGSDCSPVIVLALVWMAFVALSAAWATYSGSPGNQFRSWNKHIPIALGPLLAIAFAAACRRLKWSTDRILALFLAGLIVGALVQLVRNDAIGTLLELRSIDGILGGINRNIAALICSLAIIASVSLIHYGLFEPRVRNAVTIVAAIGLSIVLIALLLLLVLLRSRTGYIGTTLGLMAWLMAMAAQARNRQKTDRARHLQLAVAARGRRRARFRCLWRVADQRSHPGQYSRPAVGSTSRSWFCRAGSSRPMRWRKPRKSGCNC